MRHIKNRILAFSGIAFVATCFFAGDVNAQINGDPWGFQGQNRASIAALMRQVENESGSNNVVSAGSGAVTTLICGGDSDDASATGNASCIILNNSDGGIQIGQEAVGDQDANNEQIETTNVEETINVEEILSTLSGEEVSAAPEGIESLVQ